jgi:hypothetical protein
VARAMAACGLIGTRQELAATRTCANADQRMRGSCAPFIAARARPPCCTTQGLPLIHPHL